MQPRETVNRLSFWTSHQVTAADLETQIGRVVKPIPIRRSNNRFDYGEESDEESNKESEVEEDYVDCGSFDKEYDEV